MISYDQILAVLSWLCLLFIIQLSIYPWIKKELPKVAIPVSWTAGIIIFSLSSWYAVFVGLPPLTGMIPVIVLLFYSLLLEGKSAFMGISRGRYYYLLFILVFASMLIVRLYNPDINGAEKFMDHAFIASIMHDPMVPPLDPWFAGGSLNVYYYFGQWILASLGLATGISSNLLFNLALPTVAALSAINIYGCGVLTLKHTRLIPPLAFFFVNPCFIYLFLTGNDSFSLLWDSSRVIQNTINEYPLFSFLFGDVHAHVMGILPQTFMILMVVSALTCWQKITPYGRILIIFLTAIGLSLIPVVNSWDVFIWIPMILVTALLLILSSFKHGSLLDIPFACIRQIKKGISESGYLWILTPAGTSLIYLVGVPVISLFLISPFLLGMQTHGIEGVGIVHTPSSITEFLLVHGWFLLAILISVRRELIKKCWIFLVAVPFLLIGYYSAGLVAILLLSLIIRRKGVGDLLAAWGLCILMFCEFIYLKDNMGETLYRMNTVFKLYIGAWLLTGTGAALMISSEIDGFVEKRPILIKRITRVIPVVLIILCLLLPPCVVFTVHGPHTPTLDGWAWLSSVNPEDAGGVAFLRNLTGENIIVEAVGKDYQYAGRISSATGIQTILGWQFHEYMWRDDIPQGWYGIRPRDIQILYENPGQTIDLMEKYNATILYVGPLESTTYNLSLPEKGLLELYRNHDVTIYQRVIDNDQVI